MSINPAAIGIGAGVVAGVGAGFGISRLTDAIAAKHPTGSGADGPARAWMFGGAIAGVGLAAGGMAALATGRLQLGAGLLGAGAGTMLGSIGAGIGFNARHGVGVDTSVSDVLSGYDHNRNAQIDLDSGSWWREPETIRTTRTSHEDSNGNTYYTTDTYSIDRLAVRADENRDQAATRGELTSTIGGYDADGDGRLQGDEAKRFDRELGEQHIGWY